MPRNPSWRRDELILALDLYMKHRSALPSKGSTAVAELSGTLNRLASTLGLVAGDERFRNEAGVYMKLMNFLPHDTAYRGAGLRAGGKLDGEVWGEYADDLGKLRRAAAAIRRRLGGARVGRKWRGAVLSAMRRVAERHKSRKIRRDELLDEERQRIVQETKTQGSTPDQTVSRVLQELRDEGVLYFLGRGTYLLLDTPLDVEVEDIPDKALDFAVGRNKVRLGAVPTSDEKVLGRRRKGQDSVRAHTLHNYGGRCAFCDVTDERLLIAGHISRWADDIEGRGNLANVICMCRFHDALFEAGYLSLSDDLMVLRKGDGGSTSVGSNLDAAREFRSPTKHPPAPEYLRKHRKRTGHKVRI